MLKLYNSLGRKLEPFKPIKEGEVKMYTCGPTVWNYASIGNFRTFVFEDLLRRYLKFKGYKVTQVMNITDVEDNIIKGLKQSGKSLREHTSFFESEFMRDRDTLGIEKAELYPRATEHIADMLALVRTLLDKQYGYRASDGSVYFDVKKFKRYGALSGAKVSSERTTGRVAQDHYEEKKEGVDFALWKAWDEDDGEVFWETELGKGRPGWSIECSAMSMKYLGSTFDIHTGGVDNRFPHHENEIAQSEAATGKKFVNYWLHSEYLTINGEPMHKSVGNVVYLRDLVKKGWEPMAVRLFLIGSRYRDPIDLTDQALEQARAQLARLTEFAGRLLTVDTPGGQGSTLAESLLQGFEDAMDDDLNAAKAISILFTVAKRGNTLMDAGELGKAAAAQLLEGLRRVNSVLGVLEFDRGELPPRLASLLAKREGARKRRDYAESDRIRNELLAEGIVLEDTPGGSRWKRAPRG